ncbi:MAG: hypothetical protein ACK4J0_02035 [Candidatus Anstonellaceae archaeon]
MESKQTPKALYLLALFFILSFGWLVFENFQKDQTIKKLDKELREYQKTTDDFIKNLKEKIQQLEEQNNFQQLLIEQQKSSIKQKEQENLQLTKNLESANQKIEAFEKKFKSQEEEFHNIKQEYLNLLEKINNSMEWFSKNSYIPQNYSWNSDILLYRIKKDCFYKNTLNLACISYLMENTAISIKYKTDISAGKEDHLQSIVETIDRNGGDCEDYTLFFKALLNTLKKEKFNSTLELFTYHPGRIYIFYPLYREPGDSYWYYSNAIAYPSLKLNESYFYGVCYLEKENEGHCIIAISKNKINNSKEIHLLENSDLFEPQNGAYMGKISKINEQNIKACFYVDENTESCDDIIILITDEDIYYKKENKFFSLNDYKQKILDLKILK